MPIVLISFYLEFPGCFLIYIASGIVSILYFSFKILLHSVFTINIFQVGEMYLSQTLALITEKVFISSDLITSAVALFVLVTTAIAGNATLLVPFLQQYTSKEQVTISFQAASSDPAIGKILLEVFSTLIMPFITLLPL